MPNLQQLVFLGTFFSTFAVLVLVAYFLNSYLKGAGYNFSNLILLGLPKITDTSPPEPLNMQDLANTLKALTFGDLPAINVPYLGTQNFAKLTMSTPFMFSTFVLFGTIFYSIIYRKGQTRILDTAAWKEFPLLQKIKISSNTALYRFKLPGPNDVLGLPTGQHIAVSAEVNGKLVIRSYTPVSSDDDRGHFDLLIKSYEKGNISRYIALLKIGDNVRIKGPKGNFNYHARLCSHLNMIAGGTGITPMIQIIRAALKSPLDTTTISLIYANVTVEDILLKDDLDTLQASNPKRFKLLYVLNQQPPNWQGGVGYISKEHIKDRFQNPSVTDSKTLICGPPPMVSAMKKHLEELNFPVPRSVSKLEDKVFVF